MENTHSLRSLDSSALTGKNVIVRVDFNVPIEEGKVRNGFRLEKSLPTINYLRDAGAKIILLAHIENDDNPSLRPVSEYLEQKLPLLFVEADITTLHRGMFETAENGSVFLLENIRKNKGEKKNDEDFAKHLASFGDIFVNEAFSVSHRSHASVIGIPKFLPSFLGFIFEEEIKHLSLAFVPQKPFLFILGGAKFETKLPLVKKFLNLADHIYICGALADDCYRAQGLPIGLSKVSEEDFDFEGVLSNPKIMLPADGILESKGKTRVATIPEVRPDEAIRDAGPESLKDLESLVKQAKFILWNGPLGLYEGGFKEGTLTLAKMIADSSATSILGGGDTLAAIDELQLEGKFTFVSTGGGAMLDFLSDETLVGIEAVENSRISNLK